MSSDLGENDLINKYDLKKCVKWIEENHFQRTCLQFPEYLLNEGTLIALFLQKQLGIPFYVLADTLYGSCCVDEIAAEHINGDSIIHFGHACVSPVIKIPVLYIFEKKELNISNFIKDLAIFDNVPQVIIFYSDSYYHLLTELQDNIQNNSNVCLSRLCINENKVCNEDEKTICGRIFKLKSNCETSGVYIGEEGVTLTNLVLALPDVQWYRFTEDNKIEHYNFNRNKFLMQRSHLVEKVKEANVLGILIGTLAIKNYLDAVERVKLLAKRKGKKCYILAVGKPNVAKLANFPQVDVFVSISCLENSLLKQFKDYYKVIVSLFEVEMALGERSYSIEYTSDFRELLPGGFFHKEDTQKTEESDSKSQELIERHSGTLMETYGANYLQNQSWRGLEQKIGETEVKKAEKGRTGIPQTYQNELSSLDMKSTEKS